MHQVSSNVHIHIVTHWRKYPRSDALEITRRECRTLRQYAWQHRSNWTRFKISSARTNQTMDSDFGHVRISKNLHQPCTCECRCIRPRVCQCRLRRAYTSRCMHQLTWATHLCYIYMCIYACIAMCMYLFYVCSRICIQMSVCVHVHTLSCRSARAILGKMLSVYDLAKSGEGSVEHTVWRCMNLYIGIYIYVERHVKS